MTKEKSSDKEHEAPENPEFSAQELVKPRNQKRLLLSWRFMIPAWIGIVVFVLIGVARGWDARIVGGGAALFAVLSNALVWLAAVVGMIPVVGPLVVSILALPFIWLLNGIGYLVAFVAIRRGYSRDVLTYRGLTVALITGIVIGFVVGQLV